MTDRFATWNDITRSSKAAWTSHLDRTRMSQRYSHCTSNKLTRPDSVWPAAELRIKAVEHLFVPLFDHRPLHLQRRRQFAAFHRQLVV